MGLANQVLTMKVLLVLAITTLASAKPQGGQPAQGKDGKIVGGEEAPEHAFPYQISLRNLGSHICGGSIINQNQVITAAHCVEGAGAFPVLDGVIAGAHKRKGEVGHQQRHIASLEKHEDHNNPRFNNDVAIITVSEPFDFTDPHVQPIAMFMSDDAEIPAGTVCNATGWGLTNGAGIFGPNALQWVQIPALSHEDCENLHPGYITDGMVCAGSQGHTVCNGDSGGPLVCPDAQGKGKLAGLVSFGTNGCPNAAGFTKVSFYEDWIQARVDP